MLNRDRRAFPFPVAYRVLFFVMVGALLWFGLSGKILFRVLILTMAIFILSEASIYFFVRSRLRIENSGYDAAVENEGQSSRSLLGSPDDKALVVAPNKSGPAVESNGDEEGAELLKNAEREKEFNQKVLDSASLYSFIVISMDGKVKSWNSGAEHIFGWTRQEVVGKPVAISFIKDDSGNAAKIQRQRSKQVMTEGQAIFNMPRRRKNGDEFPLHCTVTALKNETGRVEGFLEISRDLTLDVKKDTALKEQIQTAHNLANSLKKIEGVVKSIEMITLQTKILALNAAVEAARAGQIGAGFSVVAEEIRTLSNNSRSAAQEIGQLVEDIRRESRNITETKIDWIEIG